MAEIKIGQTIGRYEIKAQLGRGGMAEVYKAYQASLDRYVAIKVMHAFLADDQDFVNRFQREARAMATLNHPNIVNVYDFDLHANENYYLVMEYIEGETLKDALVSTIDKGEKYPLADTHRIMSQISDALAYAHSRDMIHRDIKPGNIMLDRVHNRAVLTDFGIVKMMGGQTVNQTVTGALIGTPAYMSPEQALGQPGDARSDIYSLGVMLFQMVTGQLPFAAETPLAVVMQHVNQPVPIPAQLNPDTPADLQTIILRTMAKNPADRYPSAQALLTALKQANLTTTAPAYVAPNTAVLPNTPPPDTSTPAQGTMLAGVGGTQLHQADITMPDAAPVVPPAPSSSRRGIPLWAIALILFLLIGGIGAGFAAINGRNATPEPTTAPIIAAAATETPLPPTNTATPLPPTDTITPTPADTPDLDQTVAASIVETEEAQPTATTTPTWTPTPTPSTTPDATATYIAGCIFDVELLNVYTYSNTNFDSAPVNNSFPVNWVLQNSGTCPWPADLEWVYQDGATFGVDAPVTVSGSVEPGDELTLTTNFVASNDAGTFASTWRMSDANGLPFGPPIEFSVRTYVPFTPTFTPSPTPEATPTPEIEVTQLDYAFSVSNCIYQDSEWQCLAQITPFGGGGGPYTIFVFDQPAGQATEYRDGGTFNYFAGARRCAAFNTEVRIIDDATGTSFSRNLYIDPDDFFEGGCVNA